MASNSEYLTDEDNSCKLCQLSGPFETNNRGDDPIEEIVKAVGGKFLPWDGEPRVASEFELTAFCSQMCGQWQQDSVINLKQDEIVNNEQAEARARANRAEDDTSGIVRWLSVKYYLADFFRQVPQFR